MLVAGAFDSLSLELQQPVVAFEASNMGIGGCSAAIGRRSIPISAKRETDCLNSCWLSPVNELG